MHNAANHIAYILIIIASTATTFDKRFLSNSLSFTLAFFCSTLSRFWHIIKSHLSYVQEIRSIYRSALRRWLRTKLAGQHGLYW